ncbi:MAG: hypothetical protein ACK4K7_03300 [Allosphingosinicella sp.]|uniref:hypothetical protein n=1 Tax=Allosphingosinicella sp. TaxID=2823234 RepID=UPI00394A4619
MTLLATILKYIGWLPFAVTALFASVDFWRMSKSNPLEAFTTSLMMLVASAALIVLAGSWIYQFKNDYFAFWDVAALALIAAACVVFAFLAHVLACARFEPKAMVMAAVAFPLFTTLFWIGFAYAMYVMPRMVILNPLWRN